jgi:hypothetical protein
MHDDKAMGKRAGAYPLLLMVGAVFAVGLGIFVLNGRNPPSDHNRYVAADALPSGIPLADEWIPARDTVPGQQLGTPRE